MDNKWAKTWKIGNPSSAAILDLICLESNRTTPCNSTVFRQRISSPQNNRNPFIKLHANFHTALLTTTTLYIPSFTWLAIPNPGLQKQNDTCFRQDTFHNTSGLCQNKAVKNQQKTCFFHIKSTHIVFPGYYSKFPYYSSKHALIDDVHGPQKVKKNRVMHSRGRHPLSHCWRSFLYCAKPHSFWWAVLCSHRVGVCI